MKTRSIVSYMALLFLAVVSHTMAMATENVAKLRVVYHSSSIDAHQCGHLVVDGCKESYWEANQKDKDQWLLIDLGEQGAKASSIVIDWGENFATDYSVELLDSPKGKGKTIFQTSNGEGGEQTITLPSQNVRFLKIDVNTVREPIRGCTIREVAVMGESQGRFIPSSVASISATDLSLNGDIWRVQNASFVKECPKEISQAGYNDTEWSPARVPGTILGDYYNFGAVSDPLYGEDMHQISDRFFSGNDFWYRSSINIPSEVEGTRLFLNFDGINYRSEIFFNGEKLGRIDGAFQRGEFEITDLVNASEPNTVAVLVHHNDNWVSGSFKVIKKALGAATTNGDMLGLDGPTSLAAAGWNWLPIIKGRNNGIWNSVSLSSRSDVSIEDPWVTTQLNSPENTEARLTIKAGIKNSSEREVEGVLRASFDKTVVELPVKMGAMEQREVSLDSEQFKKLTIKNPKLWWPNGYGEQNLTNIKLEFIEDGKDGKGGKVSDSESFNFGIREFGYEIVNKVLFISCNGYRIQLKGGNWGLPEAMMRLDSEGYDLRVKLHKEANFNMIRNWIGMTNHKEFYEACDRHGILIFDDFWLANPANGPAAQDEDLFMANACDKIKWVRKYPSLVFYCGRNEGTPPLTLDLKMRKVCDELDGSRYYVSNSADAPLSGFGPYDVREPAWYFQYRGATLHSEIGIIAIPEIESLKKMMPEENLWPINNMWAVRDYQAPRSFKYTDMLNEKYGESSSVEEYSNKAQLQNFETSKAMFECLQDKQGSGMLLWMSQSAWGSLICQLYDHYLEYTSAYFGVKNACSPLHVFYNSLSGEVRLANNTREPLKGATVKATIYDYQGSVVWSKSSNIDVAIATTSTLFPLEYTPTERTLFLELELTQKGKKISDNFYWLSNSEGHCQDLNELKRCDVSMKVKKSVGTESIVAEVTLTNSSDEIALLNKVKVKESESGESILPVIYDDNYVSLRPAQSKTITLTIDRSLIEGKEVELHLEGWNTSCLTVAL